MKLKIYEVTPERTAPSSARLIDTKEVRVPPHELDNARAEAQTFLEQHYNLRSLNFGPEHAGKADSPIQLIAYVTRKRTDAP